MIPSVNSGLYKFNNYFTAAIHKSYALKCNKKKGAFKCRAVHDYSGKEI